MDYENHKGVMRSGKIALYNMDCMDALRQTPDKYYELCIVDPPYGVGVSGMHLGSRKTIKPDKTKSWDSCIPSDEYFDEIKRVSHNQIVWGGNYFECLWPTRGFIVWDKGETFYGRSFAECELAWTSFDVSARIFKRSSLDIYRIHPTQKPVLLYKWLLTNYAKPGQRILDTHLGSGSSAIAAHYFGCDFVGCEIDRDYYEASLKRFEMETAQMDMFSAV